jgi:DNA-binding transcriptional LysR family regulator
MEFSSRQLLYLSTIDKKKTLAAAADELQITQPALSSAIIELERKLGLQLFEKKGRRKILNSSGQLVTKFANETLYRAGELSELLTIDNLGKEGTLRVGMIDAASLYLLPTAIEAFKTETPNIKLYITVNDSDTLTEQLQDFEIDIAFVVSKDDNNFDNLKLVSTLILEESLVLCNPILNGKHPMAEWALYPEKSRTRALIDEGIQVLGLEPNTIIQSSNPQILRQLVVLGLATSILPEQIAKESKNIYVGKEIARRRITALRRANSPFDPKVASLIALALQVYNKV